MFARPRDASFLGNHQTSDRGKVIGLDLHVKQALNFSNLSAAQNLISAIACGDDLLRLFAADVLVFDLADDFFEDVFDGHQSSHAAVFIHYHRQIRVRLLHLAQQLGDWFGFRHKINGPDKWANRRIGFAHRK